MSRLSTAQFREGAIEQRPTEQLAYSMDTTIYGGSPSDPQVTVHDVTTSLESTGTDVSSAKLRTGEIPSVAGNIITAPHLESIEPGKRYRLTFTFTCGGNRRSLFVYIHGIY